MAGGYQHRDYGWVFDARADLGAHQLRDFRVDGFEVEGEASKGVVDV